MSRTSTFCGALLALAALTSTADAGMLGGVSAPAGLSRVESRIPTTGAVGLSARTFSTDGLRTGSAHWKKPIDSDGGGPDDPPTKPSGGGTNGGGTNGGGTNGGGTKTGSSDGGTPPHHVGPRYSGQYYGPHGDWHPEPPLACKGRPGGC